MADTATIAIITGASAGFGAEFARQLAQSQDYSELWLIARREDRLQEVAAEVEKLSQGKVACKTLVLDLQQPAAIAAIVRELENTDKSLGLLISNAGLGFMGDFAEQSAEKIDDMLAVNVQALTMLTHACLPYLQKGSGIINIASSAGFLPLPGFNVYAATKAYVLHFSLALRRELRPRGVRVTTVCPGVATTEFFDIAGQPGRGTRGIERFTSTTAASVVRAALAGHRANWPISIDHWGIKIFTFFIKFIPKVWFSL